MRGGYGLGALLVRVLEMPYLAWAWLLVLIACLLFTMVDERKLFGWPQGAYTGLMIGVFSLQGAEKGSVGYWVIWMLGGTGLATYHLIRNINATAEEF